MSTAPTPQSWPTKGQPVQIPDLSHLARKLNLTHTLNTVFAGGGPQDPVAQALIMNVIRILDSALHHYDDLRAAVEEFVTTPNNHLSPLYRAISVAEECITSLNRAIVFTKVLRTNYPQLPIGPLSCLGQPADDTRKFRNDIQHLDERLTLGRWTPGSPHCIAVKDDRLTSYGQDILYSGLATWITELHGVIAALANYRGP